MRLSFLKVDWLGSPRLAIWAVMLIQTFLGFGLVMFLFISALKAIPEEFYEAALADGASAFRRMRHITLPLLADMAVVVTVIACINSLKTFGLVYSLTRGGPDNGTMVLPLWAYLQGFSCNRFSAYSPPSGYGTTSCFRWFCSDRRRALQSLRACCSTRHLTRRISA